MNECYTPKRVYTDKVPTYVSTEYLLRELPGFDWTGAYLEWGDVL